MSSLLYLPSPLTFLLLALLSSLIGKTNGIPLSAGNTVIHAVEPSCTTLPGGSSSCNVGINTIPPLVTLDGGYQWLTVQPTTTIESGSTLTTNKAVWTATQTSYLGVTPITTTATNGATTVSTSTEYVSFITTTTAPAGAAPTALIAAAIIAPALVATLQPIVDSAGGKTAEAIGLDIVSTLAKSGIVLTADEAIQLGVIILAVGLVVPGILGVGLYHPFPMTPYIWNINIAPNPPSNSPTATLPTTTTTSSAVETVTAIGDPPYSDYLYFFQFDMTASGPTPTGDDFASSTTSTRPASTAQCTPSNDSIDVVEAQALANKFCTDLDLSKSSNVTIQGNATGLQNTYGSSIFFNFSKTANTCDLGCNISYTQIITACEFNSHTISGAGSLQDSCGIFAMSISDLPPPPATSTTTTSITPSITSATPTPTCNTPKQFTVNQDALVSAGDKFCSDKNGQSLWPIPSNPYVNGVTEYITDGASSGGQLWVFAYLDEGCTNSLQLNQDDCKAAFQSIYDKCDVGQSSRQGGAASINCQWFNITAVDQCMGSTGSFQNPGSCSVGNLPPYYWGWPLGIVAS
ncbi:hypothetical protein OIDMADRAFT_57081 [Oidiodendron maius Zn]|uniref:Uncharacterized protein n=1 Tax=Oidiodendron maius (strain Zn) TaxID=913774 RepID=A0A0C3D9W5_OIDMZ|nr:hypothetical protein OIDMADRAFT_57081 [Oidiodendron maius Zn]